MLDTDSQYSAGGVAFRQSATGHIEIALIAVGRQHRWQLPKGTIETGETPEQAALREVREEAGIDAELLETLETIEYFYVGDKQGLKTRFHKRVHFFLMAYQCGDVNDHDDEVREARWVRIDEALVMLAFKNERNVAERAMRRIAERAEDVGGRM